MISHFKTFLGQNCHEFINSLSPCLLKKDLKWLYQEIQITCNIDEIKHRVDREDITIIILDTKLVQDFILHASWFSIVGNRPIVMLLPRTKPSVTHENCALQSLFFCDPENKIFFLVTSIISKLGQFVYLIFCQSTKVTIVLHFRETYIQWNTKNKTMHVQGEKGP